MIRLIEALRRYLDRAYSEGGLGEESGPREPGTDTVALGHGGCPSQTFFQARESSLILVDLMYEAVPGAPEGLRMVNDACSTSSKAAIANSDMVVHRWNSAVSDHPTVWLVSPSACHRPDEELLSTMEDAAKIGADLAIWDFLNTCAGYSGGNPHVNNLELNSSGKLRKGTVDGTFGFP